MNENIKYAQGWQSSRRMNRFTAFASNGEEYGFTIDGAPKNIKTVGGAVKYLHDNVNHRDAYKITRALKDIEQRVKAANK